VAEARESGTFQVLMSGVRPGTLEYERELRKANGTPTEDIIGAEAVKTLENYFRQQERRSKPVRHSSNQSAGSQYSRISSALSPVVPQDIHRSELSTSSSTAEGVVSQSHSRGTSSVSTDPSPRRATPRNASLSRLPSNLQQELTEISLRAEELEKYDPKLYRNINSLLSATSVQSTPAVTNEAATSTSCDLRIQKPDEPRNIPGIGSQTPSTTLIDVSGDRPATAPPPQSRPVERQILKRHSTMGPDSYLTPEAIDRMDSESNDEFPMKTRGEPVKVKKSRDGVLLYTEETQSRRKSSPIPCQHTRGQSSVSVPMPLEYEKVYDASTRSNSDQKSSNSFITSQFTASPGIDFGTAEESTVRNLLPTDLGRQRVNTRPVSPSGESIGALSLTQGWGKSNSGSVISTHTPEHITRQSSTIPKHNRPTSRESLCDQIVSDFSMITQKNYNDELAAAEASLHASPIPLRSPARIKNRNLSNISLSPIRTVATFPEYTGFVADSDLAYSAPLTNKRPAASGAPNPHSPSFEPAHIPLTPESSLASESDTLVVPAISIARLRGVPRHKSVKILKPPSATILEERRPDRRFKRSNVFNTNKNDRTTDLEKRLSRIERENEILVQALTGISRGVQELKLIYPKQLPVVEEA
jgi:hypothetical protein